MPAPEPLAKVAAVGSGLLAASVEGRLSRAEAATGWRAQRVVTMKLSQRATRELVRAELADRGAAPAARVTTKRFHAHVRRFRERVLEASYKRKIERAIHDLAPDQRAAMREEIEAIHAWAKDLLGRMPGG